MNVAAAKPLSEARIASIDLDAKALGKPGLDFRIGRDHQITVQLRGLNRKTMDRLSRKERNRRRIFCNNANFRKRSLRRIRHTLDDDLIQVSRRLQERAVGLRRLALRILINLKNEPLHSRTGQR